MHRMKCDECGKMMKLEIMDKHYKHDGVWTIDFNGTCCNRNSWTEDYLLVNPSHQYSKELDKNGC